MAKATRRVAELSRKRMKELTDSLRVKPGTPVTLPEDFDPGHTGGLGKEGSRGEEGNTHPPFEQRRSSI